MHSFKNGRRPEGPHYSPIYGFLGILLGISSVVFRRIMLATNPRQWGEPNIGAAVQVVIGYILILSGVIWLVLSAIDRRHRRLTCRLFEIRHWITNDSPRVLDQRQAHPWRRG